MITTKIEIDLDKRCSGCGEKGAMQNGLCLKCITEQISQQGASELMSQALSRALNDCERLITSYASKISRAYLMAGDSTLKISLSIDLSSESPGSINGETTIAFTESKVKDKTKFIVIEKQEPLPL